MFETKVNVVVVPYSSSFPVFAISKRLDQHLSKLATVIDTEFAGYLDTLQNRTLYRPIQGLLYDIPDDINTIFMTVDAIHVGYATPIFPKQRANLGEVEVDEPQSHQVFFHRHPDGVDDFSSIDNQYLLPQFDVNLLVTSHGIAQMTYRIPVSVNGINTFVIVKASRHQLLFVNDADDSDDDDVSTSLASLTENLKRQTTLYPLDDIPNDIPNSYVSYIASIVHRDKSKKSKKRKGRK